MCRRQRLFIKSDYCIHGLIIEKKKQKQHKYKTKQNKKNVQSKELKFQTTQYNLSKILWRFCFVLVWLYTVFPMALIQLLP